MYVLTENIKHIKKKIQIKFSISSSEKKNLYIAWASFRKVYTKIRRIRPGFTIFTTKGDRIFLRKRS